MKYNYVIFASKLECYKYMYKDAAKMENVKFYSGSDGIFSKVEKVFHSIHVSRKVNRVVNLPLKNIWYYLLIKRIKFSDNKPICFIWSTHFMKDIENGMIEYIRKVLPNSKHVFQFTDAKFIEQDKDVLQEKMDLLSVFDGNMAKKYNFHYFPNVYPSCEKDNDIENKYDICFVGNDRGREKLLRKIAELCEDNDLRIAFYVKKDTQEKMYKGIRYIEHYMPYEDVIALIKESKCVLELKVEPYETCSLRVQEAVVLNKKILTNNPNIYLMPCCNKEKDIFLFENVEEIDWNFIKSSENARYKYNGEFDLEYCLKNIENKLFQN